MRGLLQIVMSNEQDELLTYFPEYKIYIDKIKTAYEQYLKNLNDTWNELKNKTFNNQKEFAMEAMKYSFSNILFELRKNPNMSITSWFEAQKKKLGDKSFGKKMLDWLHIEDFEKESEE